MAVNAYILGTFLCGLATASTLLTLFVCVVGNIVYKHIILPIFLYIACYLDTYTIVVVVFIHVTVYGLFYVILNETVKIR